MERKQLTAEQIALLQKPLPAAAISRHPTKTYLSSIKAIYVTERLNDVFGIGCWRFESKFVEKMEGMIVVYATLSIPDYGIELSSFGGNDNGGEKNKNFDLGDAYKGASTDALTKICSWLEIGIDVFKGLGSAPAPRQEHSQKNSASIDKAVSDAAPVMAAGPGEHPITIAQKTEILMLLNVKVITKEEKDKMVEALNAGKYDSATAEKAINKLNNTIAERQAKQAA